MDTLDELIWETCTHNPDLFYGITGKKIICDKPIYCNQTIDKLIDYYDTLKCQPGKVKEFSLVQSIIRSHIYNAIKVRPYLENNYYFAWYTLEHYFNIGNGTYNRAYMPTLSPEKRNTYCDVAKYILDDFKYMQTFAIAELKKELTEAQFSYIGRAVIRNELPHYIGGAGFTVYKVHNEDDEDENDNIAFRQCLEQINYMLNPKLREQKLFNYCKQVVSSHRAWQRRKYMMFACS
jgi:hypothetical protein